MVTDFLFCFCLICFQMKNWISSVIENEYLTGNLPERYISRIPWFKHWYWFLKIDCLFSIIIHYVSHLLILDFIADSFWALDNVFVCTVLLIILNIINTWNRWIKQSGRMTNRNMISVQCTQKQLFYEQT